MLPNTVTIQPPSYPPPPGFVRMAVIPIRQRDAQGPKSNTIYHFNPWADVEQRDVEDFQSVMISLGCSCQNNQRLVQMFATIDQIKAGNAVPEWNG